MNRYLQKTEGNGTRERGENVLRTQKDKYYCQHHYRVGFITNVCIFTVVNSWEKNRERHTEGDRLCDESYLDCPSFFFCCDGPKQPSLLLVQRRFECYCPHTLFSSRYIFVLYPLFLLFNSGIHIIKRTFSLSFSHFFLFH